MSKSFMKEMSLPNRRDKIRMVQLMAGRFSTSVRVDILQILRF